MKPIASSLLFSLLLTIACQSNRTETGKRSPISDTGNFYPIGLFIKEQIQYVDLRDFYIYKVSVTDGKKDSAAITKDQFIEWANIFPDKDISLPEKKGFYREDVFHDLSTGSLILNYTPVNPEAPIQNIAVLLAEETNLVKRIFIKTVYTRGDTLVTEQCNWKANKSFQVNRIFTTGNGYKRTELNYINWNDTP